MIRRAPAILVALLLAVLAVPASASAATQNWLVPSVTPVRNIDVAPPGYRLTGRQAIRTALGVPKVRELVRRDRLRWNVELPGYAGAYRYAIGFTRGGETRLAEVHVDGRTGKVLEVWTGPQVDWVLSRGYKPSVGGDFLNHWWVWGGLCLLFVAPFFDPRRPLRLLHLDLLMMLGFGVSQIAFNSGHLGFSVPAVYPFLLYLLGRLLFAGFKPRPRRRPLVPWMPTAVMAALLLALVGGRIALNVTDTSVVDVGFSSVIGADRVSHGEELYTDNEVHGDTYGPLNYVAYVPFEALFPFKGDITNVPAAHAAAIAFDLLTILSLFVLGMRLRAGPQGRRLGLALAFAWTAFPYSSYVLEANSNDGLVAALLVLALVAVTSAPARGAMVGVGTAAKFVPLALAPLFAAGEGDRRPATVLRFAAVMLLVIAASVFAYLPDGGLREFWNTTIGFQLSRPSPFSIWGLHPSLEPLKVAVTACAGLLAAALFFVPKRRDARQIAALAGAVVVALQLGLQHWFYFYLAWVAPLALVAMFCAYLPERAAEPAQEAPELAREPVLA